MPDHNLHTYFRFLVDHQELLQSDGDGQTQSLDETADTNQNKEGVGGALSLLGSVYGSGEDEEDAKETGNGVSDKVMNTTSLAVDHASEKTDSSLNAPEKKEPLAKRPVHSNDKLSALKKNPSIAASKPGRPTNLKKDHVSGSYSVSSEKLKEPLFLEPPPDMKRLIDKVVDFILKNGKQFEAALREQDSKQGRFPFLVPSDQYHPYYLKGLQKAQESKMSAKNAYGEDDSARLGRDKNDSMSSKYLYSDIPDESDRKEKFRMIIGKSRKDIQDPPYKATQQECGISVDAEAAAAILQAATRGFRIPSSISSSTARSDNSGAHDKDVGQASGLGSNSLVYEAERSAKASVSETTAGADSEAHLTREQKLKAERLKRARMFVAMLKSGAEPSNTEPLRAMSVEPLEPGVGVSGSPAEVNDGIKEREGSSAPTDLNRLEKNENPERNGLSDERRSKRNYRSRSEKREESDDEHNDEEELKQDNPNEEHEGEQDEKRENHKHSRKKHHSHHSSREDYDDDYKKEKSHRRSRKRHRSHRSSHEDDDGENDTDTSYLDKSSNKHSSRRSSHEKEDKKDHKRSRKKRQPHRSSRRSRGSPNRQKVYSSEDEGIQLKEHDCSSSPEHEHYDRYVGDRKRSYSEKDELEEGEISPKFSDHSRGVGHRSRETSVDMARTYSRAASQPSETTQISDDLRAKIRAMLMTTR